jgi:hypothetical protein
VAERTNERRQLESISERLGGMNDRARVSIR